MESAGRGLIIRYSFTGFALKGSGRGPRRNMARLVVAAMRQQRMGNPCVFVGQGHRRDVRMAPFGQPGRPALAAVRFALRRSQGRARPVGHEHSQASVPALADPKQPGLPAGRGLLRHQAQPGGELAAVGEGADVADGGQQGRGDERADAGDLGRPPRQGVFPVRGPGAAGGEGRLPPEVRC